jgi:glutamate dehydrogenase/leucine dehydrogenase
VLFVPNSSQGTTEGITTPRPLIGIQNLALPLSTREAVAPIMTSALKKRSDIGNVKVSVRGLGFVASAVVQYSSEEGQRWVASSLAGQLSTDPESRFQIQAAKQAIQRFN